MNNFYSTKKEELFLLNYYNTPHKYNKGFFNECKSTNLFSDKEM